MHEGQLYQFLAYIAILPGIDFKITSIYFSPKKAFVCKNYLVLKAALYVSVIRKFKKMQELRFKTFLSL